MPVMVIETADGMEIDREETALKGFPSSRGLIRIMFYYKCHGFEVTDESIEGDFDRELYHPEWIIEDPTLWSFDIQGMYRCYPDEIQSLTQDRWRELRKNVLSEERLFVMLDEEFACLHGSGIYDRDYVRWNEQGCEKWKNEYIYEFVDGRLQYLDSYYLDFQE